MIPYYVFLQVKDSAVTEMYFEEIFEQGYEAQDPLFDLRHFLYPDSGDPYVQVRRRLVYFLYPDSGDPYVHCTGKKEACIFSASRLRGSICTLYR